MKSFKVTSIRSASLSKPSLGKQNVRQQRTGFTITEIAIVLAIIGIILGGIFVAANAVYQTVALNTAQTELTQISQGIRSLYATQSVIDTAANGTPETATLIAANAIPTNMINGAVAVGPWSGSSVAVYSAQKVGGGLGDSFQISYSGLSHQVCVAFAPSVIGSGGDPSLVSVSVGGAAGYIVPTAASTIPTGAAAIAAFKATLVTGCSTSSTVAFTYGLHS